MRNIYKRGLWTVLTCAVLISSYLVIKAVVVNARTTAQNSSGTAEGRENQQGSKRTATNGTDSKEMSTQTLERIKAARAARDLKELEKIGDEIEANWSNLDTSQYASLLLEVSNALSSTILNDDRQYVLEQKYASLVLNKQLAIPVEFEAQLMLHLQEDIEYVKGQLSEKEWEARRRDKTELWLRTWQHLNAAIDPTFDFNDLPYENVPLPSGVTGFAGMSPDSIKDPSLRAQYQSAIDANNRKAEAFRTQSALRRSRETFLERMEAYLIRAYSQPPERTKELEELLKTQLLDEHVRTNILKSVKNESLPKHSD